MKKILFMLIISIVIATSLDLAFAEIQNISLKPGFNFIGFTVKPSITPQNFKTQNPAIEDIYLYNAAAGSFLSVSEGVLTSFGIGKGYIIKSNSQFSINIDGETIQAIENTSLKTGFNLIGISKISGSITFSSLMKAHAEIKGLYKWNNASGSFLQVIKNVENIPELIDGVDPTFSAGQAYFINVISDLSITFSNSDTPDPLNVIESQQKTVSSAGDSIALKSGIALNIPANAVETPVEVGISQVSSDTFKAPCQSVIKLTLNEQVKNGIVSIPVKPGTKLEHVAVVGISEDKKDFIFLSGKIDEAKNIYTVDLNENVQAGIVSVNRSKNNEVSSNSVDYLLKRYPRFVIEVYPNVKINTEYSKVIPMPSYKQVSKECIPASLLALFKGYQKILPQSLNTIYKILKYYNKLKEDGINNYMAMLFDDYNASLIFKQAINQSVEENTWFVEGNFVDYVKAKISEHKPVLYCASSHAFVINGYNYPGLTNGIIPNLGTDYLIYDINYIIQEPSNNTCNDSVDRNYIKNFQWGSDVSKFFLFNCKTIVVNAPASDSCSLQTIQLEPGINGPSLAKGLCLLSETRSNNLEWNPLATDGTTFLAINDEVLYEFTQISTTGLKITNANRLDMANVKIAVEVLINDISICSEIKEVTIEASKVKINQDFNIFKQNFKPGWEKLGPNFKIVVSLLDKDNNWLDGFDVKFKYSALTLDTGQTIETNNERNIKAYLGFNETTDVTWSILEGESGGTIDQNGKYKAPAMEGTYTIIAMTNNPPERKAMATITVQKGTSDLAFLKITPESITIYSGETTNFNIITSASIIPNVFVKWFCAIWDTDATAPSVLAPNGLSCSYTAPNISTSGKITAHIRTDEPFVDSNDYRADIILASQVNVLKPQITIVPANVEMGTGEKLKFKANVENNFENLPLMWDLDNFGAGKITTLNTDEIEFEATKTLTKEPSESFTLFAKLNTRAGEFIGSSVIKINKIKMSIRPEFIHVEPGAIFDYYAAAEGANTTAVIFNADKGNFSFYGNGKNDGHNKAQFEVPTIQYYNELYYPEDDIINITAKSVALNELETQATVIVSLPQLKWIREYDSTGYLKTEYEAVITKVIDNLNYYIMGGTYNPNKQYAEKVCFNHGALYMYDSAGKMIIKQQYNQGLYDGEHIIYSGNGNTVEVKTSKAVFNVNGQNISYYHGLYEKYYDSGKLHIRGNYEQNEYGGEWRFYYDNPSNSLKEKGMYEKDMRIGEWEDWYDNGVKKSKGNYVVINDNGINKWVKNGEWNFYYSDSRLIRMETYSNDVLNGPYKRLSDNWQGYWLGQYTNGSRSGTWNLYDLNGTFLRSETY